MTPEGKEAIRQEVAGYILGTAAEWMSLVELPVSPISGCLTTGTYQYRVSWEFPTDDAAFVTVKEMDHTEVARFGVTITVDTLPDLPSIGPENDPALAHEAPWHDPECRDVCCRDPAIASIRKVEESYRSEVLKQEWHPATFADCLAGDRIRIGDQESDVLWTTGPQEFHARNREWTGDDGKVRDHTVGRWDHIEVRMDLSANPGRREYVPSTACEILCTQERAAALVLQQRLNAKPVDK